MRSFLYRFDNSFITDTLKYSNIISKYTKIDANLHITARKLSQLFSLSKIDLKDYFIFGFIRNPWDKVVSHYHFAQPDVNFTPRYVNGYDNSRLCTFNDYITNNKFFKVTIDTWFTSNDTFIPNKIYNIESFLLDVLMDDINNRNNIKIFISKTEGLGRLNPTKHMHYSKYYNEETQKIVSEAYHSDIKYGNYIFEKK